MHIYIINMEPSSQPLNLDQNHINEIEGLCFSPGGQLKLKAKQTLHCTHLDGPMLTCSCDKYQSPPIPDVLHRDNLGRGS